MAKTVKTNVLRHLDRERIPYETREYPVAEGSFDGKLVAEELGLDPLTVYKTLVLTGDRAPGTEEILEALRRSVKGAFTYEWLEYMGTMIVRPEGR